MNSTKTQRSNKFAKAIAVLSASTLLSCSAVVLLFGQSAMSQQPTSDSEQLLAQRNGNGSAGSDGSTPATSGETSPMTTPSDVTTPNNTSDVEDRQRLSPRLSDDPNDPANRRDGTPVNSTGVEQRQERSPRLSDDPNDPAVNRSGGTVNDGSAQQRQELSPRLEDDPNANDDPTNRTPSVESPQRGTSQQPSYNQNTTPSYNQNTSPSYNQNTSPSYNQNTGNQNTGGGSSEAVRGLW
jgi:hypothetical protein